MKKRIILFLLLLLPVRVLAYSNYLVVTADPVGIEIHSNGVYIIDSYNKMNSSLKKGDKIISMNQQAINSISDLNRMIEKSGVYSIQIERNHTILDKELVVEKNHNQIQTGLYLKDEVDGIGTLSYIDPETKIYASLGHEILETNSNSLFDLKDGYLFELKDEEIKKNDHGQIGEIHASFTNNVIGTIDSNQKSGIYGKYSETIPTDHLVEVGKKEEIEVGDASILLKINNQEKNYAIKLLDVDENDATKNIYFEVTDSSLLDLTGGIIQGMSGSPIIQNQKIIGVVNYVVVSNPKTGYGIFIENMLEEGDKLLES